MESSLRGKSALVIGGTGGIGGALSRLLNVKGVVVTAVGRHPIPNVDFLSISLDSRDNCDIVCDEAKKADIVCVAWGPFLQKPLEETNQDDWDSVVYANLTLPGMIVSAALPPMIRRKWGRILLFGGTRTESIRGFKTNAAYGAAKTGISSLVKSVAGGYAKHGITCNAICPGFVATEYLDESALKYVRARNPDGKAIDPELVAELCVKVLECPELNGVALPVDKGWDPAFI